ncbi:MAG: hypothetical protein ABJF04_01620 [Reichenbachiella sp.]|uniref:hypothetical protein n=1 Tax=Reichenbachiella sp. TaxID=2184521 RepID=UPI0032640797
MNMRAEPFDMIMRTVTFVILTLWTFNSLACECSSINETNFKETLLKVDFAFVGTPLKKVLYFESELEYPDNRGTGADILVKVDSVLKGNYKSDTVYVNQVDVGNCLKMFKLRESYLIIGFEIKQYKNVPAPLPIPVSDDLPPPPPPPVTFENGVVINVATTTEYIDFQSEMLERYTTLTTDQCLSFSSNSRIARELLSK